jgi:hypothetical protein
MAPVIAFLEAKIRLQIMVCNLDVRDPVIQIVEGWDAFLAV